MEEEIIELKERIRVLEQELSESEKQQDKYQEALHDIKNIVHWAI
jgi:uncharacterized protein YfkK (UPF0435 family)